MKSIRNIQDKANTIIQNAWVTLGIPFDLPIINEKEQGIIDIESLILSTLLIMKQGRIVTDLPAWLIRFSSLVNHQKLKTMFKSISPGHRNIIIKNLNHPTFHGAPESFKKIFNLKEQLPDSLLSAIDLRLQKLNTIENVARLSIMIRNRLLYGTGFRADLVTITHIKGLGMKGSQLAKLLCANDSTISRVLNDLKACQFLDHDNERIGLIDIYPGMFMSTQSVWNLSEMIDAFKFSFKELKKSVFENLNFKHDGFGRKIFTEIT